MSDLQWEKVEIPATGADVFHYTSCGLDNIHLVGGFKRHKTNYGDGVSIANVEGLHIAIGESLVCSKESLNGPEIRFLRKEMDLTQEQLARRLRVNHQAVARWEKGEHKISGPADILLRALFKHHIGKQPNLRRISEIMDHAGERAQSKEMVFRAAA